jgi:hypothetical protein
MCVGTGGHPKGNEVTWNVVRLEDIINVGILKISPATKLNVQLAPVLSVPTPSQVISVRRAEGSR